MRLFLKAFGFFFFALLCRNDSYAQKTISVIVLDETSAKPVQLATVRMSAKDSSASISKLTDRSGSVQFNLSSPTVAVSISHLDYDVLDTTFSIQSLNSFRIMLRQKKNVRDTVFVTASKRAIQAITGGYQFEQNRTTAGLTLNAIEVMKRLPGIVQDNSGLLKLMGQPITLWVDGQKMIAQGDELMNLLRNLNARDIKSIKVYTTPPAIYDASSQTVVEIITVRNITKGLQTRIDANVGTHDKYYAGLSLNYASKSYAAFLRASYDHSKVSYREGLDQYNIVLPDSIYHYLNETKIPNYITNSLSLSTNHDFYLSAKTTFGVTARLNVYDNPSALTTGELSAFSRQNSLVSNREFTRSNANRNNFFLTGLNWRYLIDAKGSSLTADATRYYRNNTRSFDQQTALYTPAHAFYGYYDIRNNHTTNNAVVQLVSFSYNKPITGEMQLKMGGKLTTAKNREFLTDLISADRLHYAVDPGSTYTLKYNENLQAFFASISGMHKSLRYLAGIRWENTSTTISTSRQDGKSAVKRNFSNFFPTVWVSYALKPDFNISLGIKRSIIRISYDQLNPLNLRRSAILSSVGNPYLNPIFQYAFDLNADKAIGKKSSLRFMSKYSISKNPFLPIIIPDTAGQFIEKYFTYPGNNSLYMNLSFNSGLKSWLHASWALYAFDTWTHLGYIANLPDPKAIATIGTSLTLSFSFWKNAGIDLTGRYQSNQVYALGKGGKYYYADLSFTKPASDRLDISFILNDVFNSNKSYSYLSAPYLLSTSFVKNETRIGTLSLSYKFGKKRTNKIRAYQNQEDGRFVK